MNRYDFLECRRVPTLTIESFNEKNNTRKKNPFMPCKNIILNSKF
jgi:hypothetical protein